MRSQQARASALHQNCSHTGPVPIKGPSLTDFKAPEPNPASAAAAVVALALAGGLAGLDTVVEGYGVGDPWPDLAPVTSCQVAAGRLPVGAAPLAARLAGPGFQAAVPGRRPPVRTSHAPIT
jgi:hypothetical protein